MIRFENGLVPGVLHFLFPGAMWIHVMAMEFVLCYFIYVSRGSFSYLDVVSNISGCATVFVKYSIF